MPSASFGPKATADDVLREQDLSGKNVLITGPSAGIGFETARALAQAGAHVILGVRGAGRAEAVMERVRAQVPDARLSPLHLDLASFASIHQAAEAVPVQQLHLLICNAGLYAPKYGRTEEGIEQTVGVCHFGHFLLTQRLMPRLLRAQGARVVMVASESHRHPARLDFSQFPLPKKRYRPLKAYGQAKLCNVLFANELDRRYASQGIRAYSLHPGTLMFTSIYRKALGARLLATAIRPFTKTLAQGAATTVYCAASPEVTDAGGRYYADCREKPMTREAADPAVAKRLWELSEASVGSPFPA